MRRVFNWQLIIVGILGVVLLDACGDDGIIEVPTTNEVIEEDLVEIQEYITEKGYSNVDTTASRVRFVVLDEGNGAAIEYNDIVSVHYVGRFLDEEIFDTSIDTVDINNDSFDSLSRYQPFVFTHTQSGWAVETLGFVQGFSDGTTAALKKMNVGGTARLIIPSSLGYGAQGAGRNGAYVVPPNTIIVFDIYPVRVRK